MPIFGNENKEINTFLSYSLIIGGRFNCPWNCRPKSITVYLTEVDGSTPMKCAIYDDTNLFAYTEEWTLPMWWDDWKTFNITKVISPLVANTDYYLCVFYKWENHVEIGVKTTGGISGIDDFPSYNGFPATWIPSPGVLLLSIYCDVEVGLPAFSTGQPRSCENQRMSFKRLNQPIRV